MKIVIQKILNKVGLQIKRYPDPIKLSPDMARRVKMLKYFKIDTILDIGANTGQFAVKMRKLGFRDKIISFEPLSNAFDQLKSNSLEDENWLISNYALGNEDAKSIINVSNNSQSSSILNMLPIHLSSAPSSEYIAREEIEVKKLDSIFNLFCKNTDKIMMKIDTQGYEKNVIEGALESLKMIDIIQLEMSIVPLYENEMLFVEMINYLERNGFQLFALENGFSNPSSGRLLQVDGIFVKGTLLN